MHLRSQIRPTVPRVDSAAVRGQARTVSAFQELLTIWHRAVNKTKKARRIGDILDGLYPSVTAPLPHGDPYTLLVAAMLSAQTTDKRVAEVAPRLFALASTPAAMARLRVRQIEKVIRPLGLAPTKAKNLKALSRLLAEKHGGQVPRDSASLEALPGVGHKTASVVQAQAFGLAAFPVDTHIHRLAARWGLSSGQNVLATERDLKRLFPQDLWYKRHLQIIFFGREHCPARGHDANTCAICSWAAPDEKMKAASRR